MSAALAIKPVMFSGPVEYHPVEPSGFEPLRTLWVRSPLLKGFAADAPHGRIALPDGRVDLIDEGLTGILRVHPGFRCDGASIPKLVPSWIIDRTDPRWVMAFFTHDGGYKLSRTGQIKAWKRFRLRLDEVMRLTLLAKNMPAWKARAAYIGVRAGGESSARPKPSVELDVRWAP